MIDIVKNHIGNIVNGLLINGDISPTEMRYVLKSIIGEVAEYELKNVYVDLKTQESNSQSNEKGEAE